MVAVDWPKFMMDAWTWTFRMGLDEIQEAYKASRHASEVRRKSLLQDWEAFKKKVEVGEATMHDEDEDGQIAHDWGEDMGERLYEVDSTLKLIREAFTITLAHYWERDMNRRLKITHYDEKKVYKYLESKGLQPDKADLDALRFAANVAKHSGGPSAKELFKIRPDLFDVAHIKMPGSLTYDNLLITDAVVESFFDAVRRSGPQSRP